MMTQKESPRPTGRGKPLTKNWGACVAIEAELQVVVDDGEGERD